MRYPVIYSRITDISIPWKNYAGSSVEAFIKEDIMSKAGYLHMSGNAGYDGSYIYGFIDYDEYVKWNNGDIYAKYLFKVPFNYMSQSYNYDSSVYTTSPTNIEIIYGLKNNIPIKCTLFASDDEHESYVIKKGDLVINRSVDGTNYTEVYRQNFTSVLPGSSSYTNVDFGNISDSNYQTNYFKVTFETLCGGCTAHPLYFTADILPISEFSISTGTERNLYVYYAEDNPITVKARMICGDGQYYNANGKYIVERSTNGGNYVVVMRQNATTISQESDDYTSLNIGNYIPTCDDSSVNSFRVHFELDDYDTSTNELTFDTLAMQSNDGDETFQLNMQTIKNPLIAYRQNDLYFNIGYPGVTKQLYVSINGSGGVSSSTEGTYIDKPYLIRSPRFSGNTSHIKANLSDVGVGRLKTIEFDLSTENKMNVFWIIGDIFINHKNKNVAAVACYDKDRYVSVELKNGINVYASEYVYCKKGCIQYICFKYDLDVITSPNAYIYIKDTSQQSISFIKAVTLSNDQ